MMPELMAAQPIAAQPTMTHVYGPFFCGSTTSAWDETAASPKTFRACCCGHTPRGAGGPVGRDVLRSGA
jgi:hypothetical protein